MHYEFILLVRRLLSLAVLVFRGDRAKDPELPALRHENAVLRRHDGRVRYELPDRVWFAALAGLIPRTRWTEVFRPASHHDRRHYSAWRTPGMCLLA